MAERPTGTITFLFTDIEGSTRLWEQHPEAMRQALAHHVREPRKKRVRVAELRHAHAHPAPERFIGVRRRSAYVSLEHDDPSAAPCEQDRAREPRESSADDDDAGILAARADARPARRDRALPACRTRLARSARATLALAHAFLVIETRDYEAVLPGATPRRRSADHLSLTRRQR